MVECIPHNMVDSNTMSPKGSDLEILHDKTDNADAEADDDSFHAVHFADEHKGRRLSETRFYRLDRSKLPAFGSEKRRNSLRTGFDPISGAVATYFSEDFDSDSSFEELFKKPYNLVGASDSSSPTPDGHRRLATSPPVRSVHSPLLFDSTNGKFHNNSDNNNESSSSNNYNFNVQLSSSPNSLTSSSEEDNFNAFLNKMSKLRIHNGNKIVDHSEFNNRSVSHFLRPMCRSSSMDTHMKKPLKFLKPRDLTLTKYSSVDEISKKSPSSPLKDVSYHREDNITDSDDSLSTSTDKLSLLNDDTEGRIYQRTDKSFTTLFQDPAESKAAFFSKLIKSNVSLETVKESGLRTLTGIVRVTNLSFEKQVFIRATFDNWQTQMDIYCEHLTTQYLQNPSSFRHMSHLSNIPSHNNSDNRCSNLQDVTDVTAPSIWLMGTSTDRFIFELYLPLTGHSRSEFAICFKTMGKEYWDNNYHKNYVVEY